MNKDLLSHLNSIGISSLQDLLELPKEKFNQKLQKFAADLYEVNFSCIIFMDVLEFNFYHSLFFYTIWLWISFLFVTSQYWWAKSWPIQPEPKFSLILACPYNICWSWNWFIYWLYRKCKYETPRTMPCPLNSSCLTFFSLKD